MLREDKGEEVSRVGEIVENGGVLLQHPVAGGSHSGRTMQSYGNALPVRMGIKVERC